MKKALPVHPGSNETWVGHRCGHLGCTICLLAWRKGELKRGSTMTQGLKRGILSTKTLTDGSFFWMGPGYARRRAIEQLRRHQRSQQHIAAVRSLTNYVLDGPAIRKALNAPDATVFQAVLDAKKKGISFRKMPGHRHML